MSREGRRKDKTRAPKVTQRQWRRRAVFKVKEILLNSIDVYDSERIGNEGGEGVAMYDGERRSRMSNSKVESGQSRMRRKTRRRTNEP